MAPRTPQVLRRFLPWDQPLLPQAAALLAGDWRGGGPLNLRDVLVIVPTRQSGRRLREALAALAARHGAAVFPPRVMLPESLLVPPGAGGIASRVESLLAWTEVCRTLPAGEFSAVIPHEPPERNFTWALGLARQLVQVQRTLAESGLRLADVAGRVEADFPELARWRELGALEARLDAVLAAWGRQDAPAARIHVATDPVLPDGVQRIILLAAPDPQPLALAALAALARRVPVEVVVYAAPAMADAFDEWGRPRSEAWAHRPLELSDFPSHVQLCANPAAEADRVAALVRGYDEPEAVLGLGVADPEVAGLLEQALGRAGLATFNPEGRPRRGDALFQLLGALAHLAREPSFAAVEAFARCPDLLSFLSARLGEEFSAARFLAAMDELHARHLPPTLAEAQRQAVVPHSGAGGTNLPSGLALIAGLADTLRAGDFPANVHAALAALFAHRRFNLAEPSEARTAESAAEWARLSREISEAGGRLTGWSPGEAWDLALPLYGESVRYEDKVAGAVELQGWLELLWDDAPHLVVAGLNDGRVPDAIVGDPFLPESLRARLGLKTNAARLARDAYVLQALAASRPVGSKARLDLLLAKASLTGEPLRPSRLLLQCADAELPDRVRLLFQTVEPVRSAPAWRRAWQLVPPVVAPPARLAVTGFRAWLECPFRFYLSRVLRLRAVDAAKTELDVFDFGTLCHGALEAMGREPALRDETNVTTLRDFLLSRLESAARDRFGRELTLPLVVQLESARQRLSRAAEVQAATRAEGWVIEHVERPFALPLGGLEVTGKIDRIDRHQATGVVRVLDYKTSDHPVPPPAAHLRPARREETAPEFARLTIGPRTFVWTDLQLPLYRRAAALDGTLAAGAGIDCAYFNLPKAVGETAIAPWADYLPSFDAAAKRCAEGIAAAILAGGFWPPNEHVAPERDDFAALFHHGAADSIAWPGPVVSGGGTGRPGQEAQS